MSETPEPIEGMFPKLDGAQIARLIPFGRQFDAAAGDVVVDQGESNHGVFVVLRGAIELLSVSGSDSPVLRVLNDGEFSGEINMLSSRRSLVRIRACEASALLEIDRANLRRIMQTDVVL